MTVTVWHGGSLSAFATNVFNPRVGARPSSERARERSQQRADARDEVPYGRTQSCVRMALIKVHEESYYGAHRLPAGKTAAERR
jgi:hypothetical protein